MQVIIASCFDIKARVLHFGLRRISFLFFSSIVECALCQVGAGFCFGSTIVNVLTVLPYPCHSVRKMPETNVPTQAEQRRRHYEEVAEVDDLFCHSAFTILLGGGLLAACIYGYCVLISVGYVTSNCFDVLHDCQVLSVTHAFRAQSCTDAFRYLFQLPDSLVTYKQVEERQRDPSDCSSNLTINEENATFPTGPNRCFRLNSFCAGYEEDFNCAEVFELNNSQAGPCQTLLQPISDAFVIVLLFFLSVTSPLVTYTLYAGCYEAYLAIYIRCFLPKDGSGTKRRMQEHVSSI